MRKSILLSTILLSALLSFQHLDAQNIFEAVITGKLETVKDLVNKNQNLLQTKDEVMNTPLHLAIENKKNDVAIFLINKGSDVNSTSNTGETPLHIAAKWRRVEIVALLISKGAKIDVNDGSNYTPLTNAIQHYQNLSQQTGKLETIKLLVENGADINKRGLWNWLPIQVAAEFGSEEIVNYLIENGAIIPTDQGRDSYQLLFASCSKGFSGLFEKLLACGFNLQVNQYTSGLLHIAAAGGSEKIVNKLLARGFKVMTGDAYGWSPLHSAAEKGNLKIVEILIDNGADINDKNASGRTPYNLAKQFGHENVCEFLISKGADTSPHQFPELSGNYLGQKEPDKEPRVIAPDIVTTKDELHGNIVFSPARDEAFWSGWITSAASSDPKPQILTMKLKDGKWGKPEIASFSKIDYDDDSPFISPDGKKLFFVSRRPLKIGAEKSIKENIWYVTKEGDTWINPTPINEVNHLDLHWQVSVDKKGNLYFGARDPEGKKNGEIYCSKLENESYGKPERLSDKINSSNSEGSPNISPDGDYILFDRARQGIQMGIFISFRKDDGSWTTPKSITEKAKIPVQSQCSYISHDRKFLFYISGYGSHWGLYWVKADFIEEMKKNSDSPLQDMLDASRTGDLNLVKQLVEEDRELVNAKNNNGTAPLHYASSGKHLDIQKYLIEKGADVNAKERDLSTPLHYAAVRNHQEGASLLIAKGANINALDNEKHTPLHLAAQYGIKDIVSVLTKCGANLEIKDDYGRTPLVLGSMERGNPDVIRILLDAGADINSIDNTGYNALSLSALRGNKEVVDLLLDHKAALPTQNNVLLHLVSTSVQRGLVRLFRVILESGFDPKTIKTLLNDAASGGSKEIVSDLINKGFSVNEKDVNGWTPLHYAAFNGRLDAFSVLIEKGVEINSRNLMGQSAYNIADEKGFANIKQILIDNKADLSPIKFPILRGNYLGQTSPGKTPQIFAQGIISSIWGLHSTAVFSPDGNEVYWRPMITKPDAAYSTGGPYMMKRVNSVWTAPKQPSPYNAEINDDVPFFSPDGNHLFVLSTRPLPDEQRSRKENIWVMDKTSTGWTEMKPFDPTVNAQEMHWQFSMDRLGNVYFGSSAAGGQGMMDIFVSKFKNAKYSPSVNLGEQINSEKNEMTPFIAPDGSYLLFSKEDDLYVSFLNKDGLWSESINMGPSINSDKLELCPVVSPDGKYLFFNSSRNGVISAYWVDASIIGNLKPKNLK